MTVWCDEWAQAEDEAVEEAAEGSIGNYSTYGELYTELIKVAHPVGTTATLKAPGYPRITIYEKWSDSPHRIRIIGGIDLDAAYKTAVGLATPFDLTSDFDLVYGTAPGDLPTWTEIAGGVGGLAPTPQSHLVLDALGLWDDAYIEVMAECYARFTDTIAAGAYFGAGVASNGNTKGTTGIVTISGGLWYKKLGDGETSILVPITIIGSSATTVRTENVTGSYEKYSVGGYVHPASDYGASTPQALQKALVLDNPYSVSVGPANVGQRIVSGYVQQDATDKKAALFFDDAASTGLLEVIYKSVKVLTGSKR